MCNVANGDSGASAQPCAITNIKESSCVVYLRWPQLRSPCLFRCRRPPSVSRVLRVLPGAKASSSVTCTGLKGTISTTVTVSKCTPSGGKGYKTATAPASSLAAGGNLTWSKSKATTTIGNAAESGLAEQVWRGGTEYSFAGKVTAASTKGTGIPKKGDAVKALACVSSAGAVTLLAGTTMKL